MQNPISQLEIDKMVEGQMSVVQIKEGQFFAVKKQKNIQQGKILDYKIGIGKTREEALQNLT